MPAAKGTGSGSNEHSDQKGQSGGEGKYGSSLSRRTCLLLRGRYNFLHALFGICLVQSGFR